MALELNLTKNTNDSLQGTFGKYYPRVEYKGTIGTLELAKHMSAHTTSFSKGEINGMLTDLVDCIRELCLMGYVVKIEDLGLFKQRSDAEAGCKGVCRHGCAAHRRGTDCRHHQAAVCLQRGEDHHAGYR